MTDDPSALAPSGNAPIRTLFVMPRPRILSMLPPVESVWYLLYKRERVRRKFASCNFSFIFRGSGTYRLNGETFPVKAPCVLLQWPGQPMDYVPRPEWDEMAFIYPAAYFSQLSQAGVLDIREPVRPMANPEAVADLGRQLRRGMQNGELSPDRLDLLCYEILLQSRESAPPPARPEILMKIEQILNQSLAGVIDGEELAQRAGMSLATLRRLWRKFHGTETFSDFRNQSFLRESSRLLMETNLPLKNIADRLGFPDQFYFSKKFHKLAGMPPLEYRKTYRVFELE